MRPTKTFPGLETHEKITITTDELRALLGCGRKSAVEIGELAEARVQFGKRVLWNVEKVKVYINLISG